jgi:hypothetical protein
MRIFLTLIFTLFTQMTYAANAQFTILKTVTVSELNAILTQERDEFMKTSKTIVPYAMPKPFCSENSCPTGLPRAQD